jgi:hypothetical protein
MKPLFVFLAVLALPSLGLAEQLQGTILKLDKPNNRLLIKTAEGEKALVISNKTLGLEHAIDGAEVRIEYSTQDGTLRATEINPSKAGNQG